MNEKTERNKKEGKKERKQCLVTFYQIALRRLEINCNYSVAWASQVALVVKNLPANAGDIRDWSSVPGLRRPPGGGHGNPLQYSCLKNPMDRGA